MKSAEQTVAEKVGFEIRDGFIVEAGFVDEATIIQIKLWNLAVSLTKQLAVIQEYGQGLQKSYTEATPQSELARIIGKEVQKLSEVK